MADTILDPKVANSAYSKHLAPVQADGGSGRMWFTLGVIFLIAFLILAFGVFGVGNWARGTTNPQINVPVPEKIDVNINK